MPDPIATAAAAPASPFDFASTAKAVHASLDAAIAAIPPDHDGAVLLRGVTTNGKPAVQLLSAARLGANWQIAVGATWSGGTHVDGEVVLAGSWKWPD